MKKCIVQADNRRPKTSTPIILLPLILFIVSVAIPLPAHAFQITLAWDQSSGSDVRGYLLYCRRANEAFDYNWPVWAGSGTQCTIDNLSVNTLYYFVARAYNSQGVESNNSNEVSYFRPSDAADSNPDSLTPELISENISAATLYSQAHWQISRDEDFASNNLLLDVQSDHLMDRLVVPEFLLDSATDYFWRVRHLSDTFTNTEWSSATLFTTTDITDDLNLNGIPDDQELIFEIDNTVDLDNNGIPDIDQYDIKCIRTPDGNGFVGIKISDSDESGASIHSLQISSLHPDNMEAFPELGFFPFGIFSIKYSIEDRGGTGNITLYFSDPISLEADWVMYSLIEGWGFPDNVTFHPDGYSIDVGIEDGGLEDNDGLANGDIVTSGGLFIPDQFSGSAHANSAPDSSSGGGCFISSLQ